MGGGSHHDGLRSLLAAYPGLQTVYRSVRARLRPDRRPALIFVLGCEGSGANVLRRALSLDPAVRGFDEQQNDEYYVGWALRPEHEIGELLTHSPVTVLLKPVRSVARRPVAHLLTEWAGYDLRAVWIYRDPVAVYRFRTERAPIEPAAFIEEWNRINSSALAALDARMAVVCYDHLTTDEKVLHTLNTWLAIRGEYLFRPGRSTAEVEDTLPRTVVATIREGTAETVERLQTVAEEFLGVNATSAPAEQDDRTQRPTGSEL